MALLSGEVETALAPGALVRPHSPFRMALLSGEVETLTHQTILRLYLLISSGWLCYPGKLKLSRRRRFKPLAVLEFRMAFLSGEVETCPGSQRPQG